VAVPDPLLTGVRPGPTGSPAAVVRSLAASIAPAEDAADPPSWLYPQQIPSYRRVLAAMRRYGGALLADPVGTGKTYVALAVAATLSRGTITVLLPATLRHQWQRTAAALGVPLTICSHEQASRGQLPPSRGLAIIDESHRFRNSRTQRYRHVALWLVGRPALLVTATPVVNRVRDLGTQLLLAVRDDALLLDGIVSLRVLLSRGSASPSLGQLVIETEHATELRPARVHRTSSPTRDEESAAARMAEGLKQLRLSPVRPIAALLRSVLLRAAASSPAALRGSLGRYRRLLLHARDAVAAGRMVDRSELRRITGDLGEQLLWWELMPVSSPGLDLELGDLTRLDQLIGELAGSRVASDPKLCRLRDLLADRLPSLSFTTYQDTVHYLRRQLADLRPAWCTGERAGIGSTTIPRAQVLSWFRERTCSPLAPVHLIVTDVAAEGLDLQRAARVVHYDLPWTPMRIEQREGRSVRYGSHYDQVEVVRFGVPAVLERSLRLEEAVARKQGLPAMAGLGPRGRELWRWRSELAQRYPGRNEATGTARVTSEHPGLLAGFELRDAGSGARLSANLIWLEPNGSWSESPELLIARMAEAAAATGISVLSPGCLQRWLTLLAAPIRERLLVRQGLRWITPDPPSAARVLAARLQPLIQRAARRHEPARLAQLEQAIGFLARGHTSGEDALLEQLAGLSDGALLDAVGKLPVHPSPPDAVEVCLTGLIVFG
jgi:hypothetical protein